MRTVIALTLVVLLTSSAPAQSRTRASPPDAPARKSDVDALEKRLAALEERLKKLEEAIARLAPQQAGAADDPADDDLLRRELVIGMTLAQVERVAGGKGQLLSESSEGKRYKWVLSNSRPITTGTKAEEYGSYTIIADFTNGKLETYRRIDNQDRINR